MLKKNIKSYIIAISILIIAVAVVSIFYLIPKLSENKSKQIAVSDNIIKNNSKQKDIDDLLNKIDEKIKLKSSKDIDKILEELDKIEEYIRNNQMNKELTQEVQDLQKKREAMLKDIMSSFDISEDDYITLDFGDLNDFFNNPELDKNDIKFMQDFINKAYSNLIPGDHSPFIFARKDLNEIMVIYKNSKSKYVQFSASKQNDTWSESMVEKN